MLAAKYYEVCLRLFRISGYLATTLTSIDPSIWSFIQFGRFDPPIQRENVEETP